MLLKTPCKCRLLRYVLLLLSKIINKYDIITVTRLLFLEKYEAISELLKQNHDEISRYSLLIYQKSQKGMRMDQIHRHHHKYYRNRRNQHRLLCEGEMNCYCYSRVYREHFCCKCLDSTCFPGDATVQLESRETIPMSELRLGHKILTATENGTLIYTPVLAFLDRRPVIEATYLTIETSKGREIQLSENHVIFKMSHDKNGTTFLPRFARDINVNDYLLTLSKKDNLATEIDKVSSVIREIRKGAYVPLTESGTLFVGNVWASCYASFDHHLAHTVLSPVRAFPRLFEDESSQLNEGVRGYVSLLKFLGKWLLHDHFLSFTSALSIQYSPATNQSKGTNGIAAYIFSLAEEMMKFL